jgi:isopentenyl phosphate kinase
MSKTLSFLKLGGSLITDKGRASTARPERIARIAAEIAAAMKEAPEMQLLIGHGSGSFGHIPAKKYGTRQGVQSEADWRGFAEVGRQAAALNDLVMGALEDAGLAALAFSPSASVKAKDGQIVSWDVAGIEAALEAGLLPVVHGDVAFDEALGGTILSTEEVFDYLARLLKPKRILLAANEAVYADYPQKRQVVEAIGRENFAELGGALGGAEAEDVTGGMLGKVESMLRLVERLVETEVRIFAGVEAGALRGALLGEALGTRIGG